MTIKVYSREGCVKCNHAKKTMTDHGLDFEELKIGSDIDRDTVLEMFPGAKALPIITVDDEPSSLVNIMATLK